MIVSPSAFLACLFLLCTSIAHAGAFSTVILDAGHGGEDYGGSYNKIYEKHLALDTAMRVQYLLKQQGVRTYMTRTKDSFISLKKRSSIANRFHNAIFVSIHYNHAERAGAGGLETFYYRSRSKPLASYIQNAMLSEVRMTNRGVKFGRFYVIRHSRNPSVLIECGFLSNRKDRKLAQKGSFRQKIAEGIVEGIMKYQKARRAGLLH